jgi:hypothetical protein
LKKITEEHYIKVIELIFTPIKEKLSTIEEIGEKYERIVEKHKKPYKLTKKAQFIFLTNQILEE